MSPRDIHFLKHAGAEPVEQLRREQRAASKARAKDEAKLNAPAAPRSGPEAIAADQPEAVAAQGRDTPAQAAPEPIASDNPDAIAAQARAATPEEPSGTLVDQPV